MFEWDAFNERKIARHRLTKVEVAGAFADPFRMGRPLGIVNGEERHLLLGVTVAGRLVTAIYTWRGDAIRIVTAYPIRHGPEYRAYWRQRR